MRLTKRDKAIIEDLNRFRCMDRDSIAELHFQGLKNPSYAANNVLLRLLRDGHIQRSTAFVPYVYFGPDVNMKKNSAKIGHFLAILNTYKDMKQNGRIDAFLVEPKYGDKGTVEPDIFAIYRSAPFFIEVQKTIYSEKQMREKLDRYMNLYTSTFRDDSWRDIKGNKIFPHVLIISEQRYALDGSYPFNVFQATSFTEFLKRNTKQKVPEPIKTTTSNENIKIKVN